MEKDENGYRRYTEEHIAVLQQIQVYRKLGMELSAIQRILHDSQVEQEELQRLEEQMQRHLEQQSAQLEACLLYTSIWRKIGIRSALFSCFLF